MNDAEPVWELHEATVNGNRPRPNEKRVKAFRSMDAATKQKPFKRYPGADEVPLGRSLVRSERDALDVLSGRSGSPRPLDTELIGTLLFLCDGVTRIIAGDRGRTWFRTAMSAGNLHPLELYLVRDGVEHYQPAAHGLVALRPAGELGDATSGAMLVVTGIPARTTWKYGERGWRHLYWDAGTAIANLLAAARAHGVAAHVAVGFDDRAVAELVGVDGIEEMPLALVRLGDEDVEVPPAGSLGPVVAESEPVAPGAVRFPLVEAAQAASVIGDDAVRTWPDCAVPIVRRAADSVDLPSRVGDVETIEDVILRRGSTRRFLRQEAAPELLGWALAAATRTAGIDVAPVGTLLEHLVAVHDVAGIDPGRYLSRGAGGIDLVVLSADVRAESQRMCLGQPLGGDSAYTVFHSCELGPLFERLGGRGYRAAQLEAGIVSGTLALCSFALSGGATGLTFLDEEVSAGFGTAMAPMLATAVGLPVSPLRLSGSPGEPARMRRKRG